MFQPHTKFEVYTIPAIRQYIKGSAKCRNCGGLDELGATQGYRQCRGIPSYLSKVAIFSLPHLYLAPPLGVNPFEFCRDSQRRKTRVAGRSCGVVCVIVRLAISL